MYKIVKNDRETTFNIILKFLDTFNMKNVFLKDIFNIIFFLMCQTIIYENC